VCRGSTGAPADLRMELRGNRAASAMPGMVKMPSDALLDCCPWRHRVLLMPGGVQTLDHRILPAFIGFPLYPDAVRREVACRVALLVLFEHNAPFRHEESLTLNPNQSRLSKRRCILM